MEHGASTASSGDKRKRGGDSTKDPQPSTSKSINDAGSFSLLADLPSGAIQNILDIQKSHKDRASLRLTCQGMHNEVEIFCKDSMARLKKKHQVDDTFDRRIRDQTDLTTPRTKPLHLPFFYLLWKAMKTYLYKLESQERNADPDCVNLQLSESEDRIAVSVEVGPVADDYEARLWDLNTKQLLHVIDGPSSCFEFLIGDSVVICPSGDNSRTFRVHSQSDGSLLNEYQIPNEAFVETNAGLFHWMSHGDKILFSDNGRQIHSFDARNGTFRMNLLTKINQNVEQTIEYFAVAVVTECCGLVVGTSPKFENDKVLPEIHVLDLDDYSTRYVFRGVQYQFDSVGATLEPYPLSGSKKVMFFRNVESNPEVLDFTCCIIQGRHLQKIQRFYSCHPARISSHY